MRRLRRRTMINARRLTRALDSVDSSHRTRSLVHSLIEAYAPAICTLPERARYVRADLMVPGFQIAAEGRLAPGRCLSGFPHPSGANGHRVRKFAEGRVELRRVVERALGKLSEARCLTTV